MQFFTSVPIQKNNFPISYNSKITLLGSCFAENIDDKLHFFKFDTTVNPFGIIFNPVSIEKIIKRAIFKNYFTENDIFFHNNLWHCFEVHSNLSVENKIDFLYDLNSKLDFFHTYLHTSSHLILTLGTAWVYKNGEEIVANCHKVPQKEFTKKLLAAKEIEESLFRIISMIEKINSSCKFIFTVSPVRHIKDGFFENNVSKAQILTAVYSLLHKNNSIYYFPSFEIMIDELRDYRFYNEDMLHPNSVAIDYIWNMFSNNCINESCIVLMQEIDSIQKQLNHKLIHPNSNESIQFKKVLQNKIIKIEKENPF